jgi:hypothetical protein
MRSAVALLTLALAAPAPAQSPPVTGISDQNGTTLTDPLFQWLGVRHARLIVPWDVALTAGIRQTVRSVARSVPVRRQTPTARPS